MMQEVWMLEVIPSHTCAFVLEGADLDGAPGDPGHAPVIVGLDVVGPGPNTLDAHPLFAP